MQAERAQCFKIVILPYQWNEERPSRGWSKNEQWRLPLAGPTLLSQSSIDQIKRFAWCGKVSNLGFNIILKETSDKTSTIDIETKYYLNAQRFMEIILQHKWKNLQKEDEL